MIQGVVMINSAVLDEYDGEIFFYYGDISRGGYSQISHIFEGLTQKKDKACIVLVTYGGDPDAAYRIARATNHHFSKIEILIPDICKSAGTLVCVGAHKLIFGDRGELGPLDIQLSKPDEMFENMSGLDIIQAINALQNQVLDSFRTYLVDIRAGSRLRTKTAAEVAIKLAEGFIKPIADKIDPLTLGAHQRAMQIAYDYGERLNSMTKSLKNNALAELVSSYPSHGFVIDRREARNLFNNVSAPDELTHKIYEEARLIVERLPYPAQPIVINFKDHIKQIEQANEGNLHENNEHIDNQGHDEIPSPNGNSGCEGKKDEQNVSESSEPGDSKKSKERKRTTKITE